MKTNEYSSLDRKSKRKTTRMEEFDIANFIRHFWISFKRFFAIIVLITVVAVIAVYAYFKATFVPEYKSKISFSAVPLAADGTTGASLYRYNYNVALGTQLSLTFPKLIESGIFLDIIRNETGKDINGTISVLAIPKTNIFEVTVTSESADDAYDIIMSIMRNYPKLSENVLGDITTDVIIEPQKPTSPSNANDYVKYMSFTALAGAMGGIIFLCVYVFSRKTVCNKSDVLYTLNQNHLGEIPLIRDKNSKSGAKSKIKRLIKNRAFTEANRSIKNRTLNILNDNNYRVIGITATTENEGKSSFAAGYAKAISNDNDKVLLVVLDSPKKLAKGKSKSAIEDLKSIATEKHHLTFEGIKKLFSNVDVVFMDSEKFRNKKQEASNQIEKYKQLYSYVIIDMPACNSHTESVNIADNCDAYIMVVRCDYTSVKRIKSALQYLSYSRSKSIGTVLNEVSSSYISYGRYNNYGGKYGYGAYSKYSKYGYGYGYGKGYGYGYGYGYGNYGKSEENAENGTENASEANNSQDS